MGLIDRLYGKIIVKCPDGSKRIVFNDPNKAFPLNDTDWSAKLDGAMDSLNELQIKLGGNFGKSLNGFYTHLDDANCSLQFHFRALYVTYTANPCTMDGWLKDEICRVIEKEHIVRRIELEIKRIISLKENGNDEQTIKQAILDSLTQLSKSEMELEMSTEFQKVEINNSEWEDIQ